MADVYIVIVYCYNPCTLGAKEEILYADGEKTTTVTAQVTGGGGQPLKDVEVTFTVVGGGAANPVKVKTGDDGQATTTITAATLDGVKTRSSISTVKATAGGNDPATATIYMFRSRTTPGPPEVKFFHFNAILTDDEYTKAPDNLNAPEKIETWLRTPHFPKKTPLHISGLAWRGYGPISKDETDVLVDPVDVLPNAGTIRIGEEEITYTGKNLNYPPKLTGCGRGANQTNKAEHNQGNANDTVLLKTELDADIDEKATTIQVKSIDGAAKSRGGKGQLVIGNEIITYTGWDATAKKFTSCVRGQNAAPHKKDDPAFYEVARAGTLISRIIHYTCVDNKISPAVVLVQLEKEAELIRTENPADDKLNNAMGLKLPNGQQWMTNPKHQLEYGVKNVLRKYYDDAPDMPHIFPKGRIADHGIRYYVSDQANPKSPSVRVRIENKATYALYKFTPWIRSSASGGGTYLFRELWDFQFGF
jgi:hypothetical protein